MKNRLFKIAAILCLSLSYITPNNTYANHAAGGEIIYSHISDSAYQFILKFYRDCGGPQAPASFNLCIFNTCTNQMVTVPMALWGGTLPPDNRPNGSPVSPGCSNTHTSCDGFNAVPGYEEWWYSCIVTALPLKCNYWKFACLVGNTSLCCRNSSTNLVGTPNFYIETKFNATVWSKDKNGHVLSPWENSSPYYSVKPVPYVCLNIPYSYNNGAIDPDGDSLWSQMINPLSAANCTGTPSMAPLRNLNPAINFSTNPFPTNNTFNLNGGNGQLSFSASTVGAGTMTIQTKEYRKDTNNVVREIGSIMRDVQVRVLSCSTVVPRLDTVSVSNGHFENGKIYGCVGEKLQFCFTITSAKLNSVLLAEDNLKQAIPTAKISYTGLGTDTVKGCFEWTPSISDIGPKTFIVIMKDSTCDPPGILFQYAETINLHIWGPVDVTPDTSICSGESIILGVTGGGKYVWNILSGTDPSLSTTTGPVTVATPKTKTVYQVISNMNKYCPDLNKDTVSISVLNGPQIKGQPDDTTCPNYPVKMDIGLIRSPGAHYNIKWTPATGLNNTSIANPETMLKKAQEYHIEVSSDINRCKTFDTVLIDVLKGLMIENPDTSVCQGDKVVIRGKGDSRYTFKWVTNDNGAVITAPGQIITDITPGTIGKHTYTLHGTYYKCMGVDSTAELDIDMQPIPTAKINDDASLCYGDTMQLNAVVVPGTYPEYSYNWQPGAALNFPDHIDPIFSAINTGVNNIRFIVSTPAGCSDTDEIKLNVFAAEFVVMPNDTAICPGDSISLNMNLTEEATFQWSPDFNISDIKSLQPIVWPVGKQTYKVVAMDKLGCLDTADVTVNVFAAPILDIPHEVKLFPGESYRVDPGGNCLYYNWFPPLGMNNADVSNPNISPDVDTRYIVTARTESGCSIKDTMNVIVLSGALIEVPNAFSPGNNGTLRIIKRGDVQLRLFSIYSRWGTKVFETSDIYQGWDGTYNGEKQPTGVYIYAVKAVGPSGEPINKQGNITLLR